MNILPSLTEQKVSPSGTLNIGDLQKLGWNLLKFTAPALAIFFAQMQLGVDPKVASLVALYALYGAISDYLKKLNEGK